MPARRLDRLQHSDDAEPPLMVDTTFHERLA